MQGNDLDTPTSSGLAKPSQESKALMAYYGEGSGPNKRPHVEEEPQAPQPSQPSQPTLQGSQPSQAPPHQPLPSHQHLLNQPNQGQPNMSQPNMNQGSFFQQPFQFQAMEQGRPRRKGQRKAGKKIEAQPVTGVFNEQAGSFDQPVSVRTILQGIKFDISMMDFVAWSPAAGREMKRLCSKIPKKRGLNKDKQPAYHFNPAFVQQPFQPFQPMQSVPGVPVPPAPTMPQAPQPAHHPYQAQQNPYTSTGQV